MSVSLTVYPFRKRTFNPVDVILAENDCTCCIVRRVCINKDEQDINWSKDPSINSEWKIQRLQSLVSILLLHIVLLTTILSTICRAEICVRMHARIAHLLSHRLGHVANVRSHSQQSHDFSPTGVNRLTLTERTTTYQNNFVQTRLHESVLNQDSSDDEYVTQKLLSYKT